MTLVPGPEPGASPVTVWSLEMTSPAQLRPAREPDPLPLLLRAERPAPELSRFFYGLVGGPWLWVDRLDWSTDRWQVWVDRPEHTLVTAWLQGAPAGYYELERQEDAVELAYFGLVGGLVGRGLGGWLLTRALEDAWSQAGVRRVWVHTCSLDGPAALANYEARGMRRFAEDVEWRLLPGGGSAP